MVGVEICKLSQMKQFLEQYLMETMRDERFGVLYMKMILLKDLSDLTDWLDLGKDL